jgi:glycosyltransferase involved in cell wall biosynthesis
VALFVTHATAVGGAEVVLARYLAERTAEHEVLALSNGAVPDFFAAAGIATSVVPIFDAEQSVTRHLSIGEALASAARTAGSAPKLLLALRRSSHHVVVTNSMKAHAVVPVLARLNARAVGIRLHDILSGEYASGVGRAIVSGSSRAAVSTAAVSQATARAAREAGVKNVTWFYNGVSIEESTPPRRSETLRALAVCRLTRWKGIHHVLESIALARRALPDIRLDIVGEAADVDRDYAQILRRQAESLGIAAVVDWHGFQAQLEPFYRAADVFVHLPEEPEPLGTALIEAQAHGLPVVGIRSGGTAEIVADGETGFLVSDLDHTAVAERLVELRNVDLRLRMGRAGRARMMAEFSHERYVEAFDSWLATLAQHRRRRGEPRPPRVHG